MSWLSNLLNNKKNQPKSVEQTKISDIRDASNESLEIFKLQKDGSWERIKRKFTTLPSEQKKEIEHPEKDKPFFLPRNLEILLGQRYGNFERDLSKYDPCNYELDKKIQTLLNSYKFSANNFPLGESVKIKRSNGKVESWIVCEIIDETTIKVISPNPVINGKKGIRSFKVGELLWLNPQYFKQKGQS